MNAKLKSKRTTTKVQKRQNEEAEEYDRIVASVRNQFREKADTLRIIAADYDKLVATVEKASPFLLRTFAAELEGSTLRLEPYAEGFYFDDIDDFLFSSIRVAEQERQAERSERRRGG
jgi:hypothetical protein